jgi:hypothetical protein
LGRGDAEVIVIRRARRVLVSVLEGGQDAAGVTVPVVDGHVHRGTQCRERRPSQRQEHGQGEPTLCDPGHGRDYGGVV